MKTEETLAPASAQTADTDAREKSFIADIISIILRVGVVVSAAVLLVGLVLYLIQGPSPTAVSRVLVGASSRPPELTTVGQVFRGLSTGQPTAIIELGALLLLATPVIRVGASIFLFLAERDILYTVLTTIVLTILLI
ncbi:MAG: DUF1634 domain-containing protein, partial [Chloroflexota bacterium]